MRVWLVMWLCKKQPFSLVSLIFDLEHVCTLPLVEHMVPLSVQKCTPFNGQICPILKVCRLAHILVFGKALLCQDDRDLL